MKNCALLTLLVGWFAAGAVTDAQTALPPPNKPVAAEEEAVMLSPFTVASERDEGYLAANSLAGTRMNTSLARIPAAVSVLTKELLDDLGAENINDALRFLMGSSNDTTSDASGQLVEAFDTRATIRGFKESSLTRDYLPNMVMGRGLMASDGFNVERIDLSRGPNSILYGVGGPGGVINTTSKRAMLNGEQRSVSVSVGRWAKKRTEADLSFPLMRNRLALRLNTVWEDREGWWEFEMFRQKGLAASATYQLFKGTQVRAGIERVIREQVLGGRSPHADFGYSRWVKTGSPLAGDPLLPGNNPAPGILRTVNTLQVIYAPQIRAEPFRLSTTGADMRPDLPGVQAPGYWETVSGGNAPAGGTVDDPFYGQVIPANAYLSGPGRNSNNDYTVSSVFLDQRISGVDVEIGYARSTYSRSYQPGAANAIGDPNPVLPGAYYADGDSVIAAGRVPGTLLPDIGRANPFVGGLYVQLQSRYQVIEEENEHFRVSLGHKLDLTDRHPWLGRHTFAGVWQSDSFLRGGGILGEYNLTPSNNQPIDSPTNTILRRTYLDFSKPDGVRGALDPSSTPLPNSPGMTAGYAWSEYPWGSVKNTTGMVAMQNSLLLDRLVLTAGYRRDRVENNSASAGGERLPNSTNLWKTRHHLFASDTVTRSSGPTTTFGAVVMPLRWLSFAYNQSESILPQQTLTIFGSARTPLLGEGKDYGVRFTPAGGRLSAAVNFYQNVGLNQWQAGFATARTAAAPALNAILAAMRLRGETLPSLLTNQGLTQLNTSSREAADSDGKGSEIEVVGRITAAWSLSMNYSRNRLIQTKIAPDMNGFLAAMKGSWDGNATPLLDTPANVATYVRTRDGTPNRDFVLNPASFNDAYDYAVSVMEQNNISSGKPPLAHVEESFNVFSSYRMGEAAWWLLKRARIGFGANYRGPAVIGYDAANGSAPIWGGSSVIVNAMAGKRFPLRKRQALDVQINVTNLFKQEDLVPFSATSPGNVVRYWLPATRHSWTVRAVYSF
jgi:iron complex outermembrane receptor protein